MAGSGVGIVGSSGLPKASFNLMLAYALMVSIGAGVLALPERVMRAGCLWSLLLSLYVGLGIAWTMRLVLRAKQRCEANGIRIVMYRDLGRALLGGEIGRRGVEFAVCGYQFGVLCVYYELVSKTMSAVTSSSETVWMILLFPTLSLLCCLQYLRDLGFVAEASSIFYGVAWLVIMGYCLERIFEHGPENTRLLPKNTPWSILSFFGAMCYSFEGIPAALCQMVDTLDDVRRAGELVTASVFAVIFVYIFTEFVGAFAFERPLDPITLNLMSYEGNYSPLAVSINVILCVSIVLKYPLQYFPMISVFERNMNIGPGAKLRGEDEGGGSEAAKETDSLLTSIDDDHSVQETENSSVWVTSTTAIAFRVAVVLASGLIAYFVGNLDALIDLIGITFAVPLAIISPCLFDLFATRRFGPPDESQTLYFLPTASSEKPVTYFFLITGIFMWIFGTTQQIVALVSS